MGTERCGFADFIKFQWKMIITLVELYITKKNRWAERHVLEVRNSDLKKKLNVETSSPFSASRVFILK